MNLQLYVLNNIYVQYFDNYVFLSTAIIFNKWQSYFNIKWLMIYISFIYQNNNWIISFSQYKFINVNNEQKSPWIQWISSFLFFLIYFLFDMLLIKNNVYIPFIFIWKRYKTEYESIPLTIYYNPLSCHTNFTKFCDLLAQIFVVVMRILLDVVVP